MDKYFFYVYKKCKIRLKTTKYKILLKKNIFLKHRIRVFLKNCNWLSYRKKFIFNLYDNKKPSLYFFRGICYYSAKYKGSINKLIFKKNNFKFLLNYNFIPNMWKKFK